MESTVAPSDHDDSRNDSESTGGPSGPRSDDSQQEVVKGIEETDGAEQDEIDGFVNLLLGCTGLKKKKKKRLDTKPLIDSAGDVSTGTGNTSSDISDISYDFSHRQRGYAVIICNAAFADPELVRRGSGKDLENMAEVLTSLGFSTTKKCNLTASEMEGVLKEFASKDHRDADCFACAILTHGTESVSAHKERDHMLQGSDCQYIATRKLLQLFDDRHCPSLQGKPRLFFIQACRGVSVDDGTELKVLKTPKSDQYKLNFLSELKKAADESDAKPQYAEYQCPYANECLLQSAEPILTPVPCYNDFIVAFACPPGYYAWRNSRDGSWFITFLHQLLWKERDPDADVISVLTRVSRLMALTFQSNCADPVLDKKKAIPCFYHMLTKSIYFR